MPVVPSQPSRGPTGKARESDIQAPEDDQISKQGLDGFIEPVPKPRSKRDVDNMGPPKSKKTIKSSEVTAGKAPAEPNGEIKKPVDETVMASGKKHPGKLNIDAAKDVAKKGLASVSTTHTVSAGDHDPGPSSSKATSAVSQPETPLTAVSQPPGIGSSRQTQARAFRVVATPKAETPQGAPTASPSVTSATDIPAKQASRRGSLSSLNPPGTPASERISDNVSLTSTSMSRANSPPPGKVGSATARHVSKSQQKKERQLRAKQAEEVAKVEEAPAKVVEEPVQAPIIGRKKKTKKPATRETTESTPAITRPTSPTLAGEKAGDKDETAPSTPVRAVVESEADTPISPAGASEQQHRKSPVNAASIFSMLQSRAELSSTASEVFKPVLGLNHRFEIDPNILDHGPEVGPLPTLSDIHTQQIEQGEAICVEQPNTNKRVIVLPDRRTLRGLTADQARRYLQLRKQALNTNQKLHDAGHGPAPPKIDHAPLPGKSSTLHKSSQSQTEDLSNPFLTTAQQQPPQSSYPRLPQAFGSSGSANPTTYVDEAAAFIATRRGVAGQGMSVEEAEASLGTSRKETEGLEKRLNALLKRNRRMVFGGGNS